MDGWGRGQADCLVWWWRRLACHAGSTQLCVSTPARLTLQASPSHLSLFQEPDSIVEAVVGAQNATILLAVSGQLTPPVWQRSVPWPHNLWPRRPPAQC